MRIDEVQILLDQSRIALNQGRFDEAMDLLDRVLADDDSNEQALNLKGLILFKQNRYDEAVELFSGLLQKYPDEPTLLMNLGLALLKSERYEEAIVELNKAAERNPGNPKIHNYLGLAYSGIGRLREAQENFLEGGSKKMAEQMLLLMKSSSGEATGEEEAVEVDVDNAQESIQDLNPDDTLDAAFGETFALGASDPGTPNPAAAKDVASTAAPQSKSVTAPAAPGADTVSATPTPSAVKAPPAGASTDPVPTDLLGSAVNMLRNRYEAVLDTVDAGVSLQQLTERLRLQRDAAAKIDMVRPNVARIPVIPGNTVLSRLRGLVAIEGDVRGEVRQKRYKGKDIKSRFGSEQDPVFELIGSGAVLVEQAGDQTMFAVKLEGELVYVVEDAFFALSGDWRWENGRLPANKGADLHLVQLRGEGALLLSIPGRSRVGAVALSGQKLAVPLRRLVGWYGNVVPVLIDTPLPGDDAAGAVQFQGDGAVLLAVAAK